MQNQEEKLYELIKVYNLCENCFILSHCKNTLKDYLLKIKSAIKMYNNRIYKLS